MGVPAPTRHCYDIKTTINTTFKPIGKRSLQRHKNGFFSARTFRRAVLGRALRSAFKIATAAPLLVHAPSYNNINIHNEHANARVF